MSKHESWEYKFVCFDGGIGTRGSEIRKNPYMPSDEVGAAFVEAIAPATNYYLNVAEEIFRKDYCRDLNKDHFKMIFDVWMKGERKTDREFDHYVILFKKFLVDSDGFATWDDFALANPPYVRVTLEEVLSTLGPGGWELICIEHETAILKRRREHFENKSVD